MPGSGLQSEKTKMDKMWALPFMNSWASGKDKPLKTEVKYDGVKASAGDKECVGIQVSERLIPLVKEAQRRGGKCAEP